MIILENLNLRILWNTLMFLYDREMKDMNNNTLYDNFRFLSENYQKINDAIMKDFINHFMMDAIDYIYNPNIKWLVNDINFFIKNNDSDSIMRMRLKQEWRRLKIFLSTGNYVNMKQTRRDELFHELLEIVHPDDANLLLSMMKKTLPFENLTKEYFENLIPEFKERWKVDG